MKHLGWGLGRTGLIRHCSAVFSRTGCCASLLVAPFVLWYLNFPGWGPKFYVLLNYLYIMLLLFHLRNLVRFKSHWSTAATSDFQKRFIVLSIKCDKIVKNVCRNFPESLVMTPEALFCLTNSPEPLNIQFSRMYDEGRRQILTSEQLKNVWNDSLVEIVANAFLSIDQSINKLIVTALDNRFR